MIEIKKWGQESKDAVQSFIHDNCSEFSIIPSHTIMAVEEGGIIIGISVISFDGSFAQLEALVIDRDRRGEYLGDSLLRASLNYISSKGIYRCIWNRDYGREYFTKRGFGWSTDGVLEINIQNFFSQGCRGGV